VLSGMAIVEKSQELLGMHSPDKKIKTLSLWNLLEFKIIGIGKG
jgi:hypothetical protein